MKLILELRKTFEVDLKSKDSSDLRNELLEKINEQYNDDEQEESLASVDKSEIHDAAVLLLENDINAIVDLDIDETDFTITVQP